MRGKTVMREGKNSTSTAPAGLSVPEAANYLGVSTASIWRLLKSGDLPRTRILGRTVIRRADADAFLARCVGATG